MTLVDALNLAYAQTCHRHIKDKDRYLRAYEITYSALRGISGEYDITTTGTSFTERSGCCQVDKFSKEGKITASYQVNLYKPLCCTCLDVQQNGVITCKHAYAYQLYRLTYMLFAEFCRSNMQL